MVGPPFLSSPLPDIRFTVFTVFNSVTLEPFGRTIGIGWNLTYLVVVVCEMRVGGGVIGEGNGEIVDMTISDNRGQEREVVLFVSQGLQNVVEPRAMSCPKLPAQNYTKECAYL